MTAAPRDGGHGASAAGAAGGRWDEPAIAEIYQRCGGALFGTALRMLRKPEEAEEVVQETFVALLRSGPAPGEGEVGAWLHRVAVNQCLDRLRRAARWRTAALDEEVPTPAAGAARLAASPSLRVDLERAVALLPERARLVFLLHDLEGYSHEEIGELLGIEVGTSKSQLARARALLRAALSAGRGQPDRP